MINLFTGEDYNPCLSCGACCAFFQVSFYWAEADDALEDGVPVHLTEKLNHFRRVMKANRKTKTRCIALEGIIGENVLCSIYDKRPSVCRNFEISWNASIQNFACDKARTFWNLPVLKPPHKDHPDDPGNYPRAA